MALCAVWSHFGVPGAAALIRWARVQHALILAGSGACVIEKTGWLEIPVVGLPLAPTVGNVHCKLLVTLAQWAFTIAIVCAFFVHWICFKWFRLEHCSFKLTQNQLTALNVERAIAAFWHFGAVFSSDWITVLVIKLNASVAWFECFTRAVNVVNWLSFVSDWLSTRFCPAVATCLLKSVILNLLIAFQIRTVSVDFLEEFPWAQLLLSRLGRLFRIDLCN